MAEGRRQSGGAQATPAARPLLPAAYCPLPSGGQRGFTLMEMLVVMGLIIIALAMAVPALKYITGSSSNQVGENAVSAMLARARSDAIALQQPQGVLFLLDQATDRVMLYQVMQSILQNPPTPDPPGVTYLDLTPDRDPLALPPGVRAWTIKDTYFPVGDSDPFPAYRYLGFNNVTTVANGPYTGTSTTDKALIGGVILFDGQGNLLATPYGFRYLNTGVTPNTPTALAGLLFTTTTTQTPPALPTGTSSYWPPSAGVGVPPTIYLRSQLGLVLIDKDTFQNQERQAGATTSLDGNPTGGTTAEGVLDPWLDLNATPLLINRYNGTLTRAE